MTVLDTIVAHKRTEVGRLPRTEVTPARIRAAREAAGGVRDFVGALRRPRVGRMGLIAEVKKASPSAGVIRPGFDPVAIARGYEAGGAGCISVLTDERFFQGSLDDLAAIRAAVGVPLLRKDFVIDERQVLEAAERGADAVLLIVAILEPETLKRLLELATASGLAALVEVHDEAELEGALEAGATLVGVNNRDLKTFQVDLGTTERLAARLGDRLTPGAPNGILLVAESGVRSGADVRRLSAAGAGAILVGETLMREDNPGAKIRELVG